MPITFSDGSRVILRNEMTDGDFDVPGCNWLHGNFKSVDYHPAFGTKNDPVRHELVRYFNENMRGPFYIVESGSQGYGGYMTTSFYPIIIHPADRKDFANRFIGKDWKEEPDGVEKNAVILTEQAARGYVYENRAMALLLEEIRSSPSPVVLNGNDIDSIAARLWPEPVKPPAAPAALISVHSMG